MCYLYEGKVLLNNVTVMLEEKSWQKRKGYLRYDGNNTTP